jgi:two-component system, chemotaxis family, sensor kinase CheA
MKSPKPAEPLTVQAVESGPELDRIVSEFLSESRENLDQIDRELNELGKSKSSDDLLPSVFRAFHSIKGASGFLEFTKVERLMHAAEGVLTGIRDGRLLLGPAVSAALHDVVDCVRDILETVAATGQEGDGDCAEVLRKLRRVEQTEHAGAAVGMSGDNGRGAFAFLSEAAGEDSGKPIGQLLIERAGVSPAAVQAAREQQRQGDLRTLGQILVSEGVVTPVAAREIAEYQQEARAASVGESSVRVEIILLDKIVNMAEDTAYFANQLAKLARERRDDGMTSITQQLLRGAIQLHHEAMNTRVQPFGTVEPLLSRLVADLSRLSGKHVRLEVKGRKIAVDRVVLAAIKDPLLHLVRNAVDHGIEAPQGRLIAGKPSEGRVQVTAARSDSLVVVEVSDDGAGIDLDRVREKAVAQGLISRNRGEHLSDAEIVELVFLPGFTTAPSLSHISGRGVGMDIVKTKLEKIGGTVELLSRKGLGTTVRLTIPLAKSFFARDVTGLQSIDPSQGTTGKAVALSEPSAEFRNLIEIGQGSGC